MAPASLSKHRVTLRRMEQSFIREVEKEQVDVGRGSQVGFSEKHARRWSSGSRSLAGSVRGIDSCGREGKEADRAEGGAGLG